MALVWLHFPQGEVAHLFQYLSLQVKLHLQIVILILKLHFGILQIWKNSLRQSDTFLQNAHSTSSKHLPDFDEEQFRRVPGRCGIGLFVSECSPSQEKNHFCGMTSSPLKQENEMEQNAPTHLALRRPRKEIGCKNIIPDMNLEPPAPIDKLEPTSSTTQSLDLRSLLGHNEQPSSLKADFSPVVLLEQEPGGRWVKRLKISASGSFSVGTKSANLAGNTSHEKANKFLSKITKVTISGSELTAGKLHGEELMALDKTPALASNSVSSSANVMKKNLELLISQSWMRRWLHNRNATAQKRPQPVVVCKSRDSKLEINDFRKKQFPSIAAMALMGKALTGFQPCEFQNRGPYVVWRNTGVSEPT